MFYNCLWPLSLPNCPALQHPLLLICFPASTRKFAPCHFLGVGLHQVPQVDLWVTPIIQGFVQVEELMVNYNETVEEDRSSPDSPQQEATCVDDIYPRFTVAIISRRSRHRAGMDQVTLGLRVMTLYESGDVTSSLRSW